MQTRFYYKGFGCDITKEIRQKGKSWFFFCWEKLEGRGPEISMAFQDMKDKTMTSPSLRTILCKSAKVLQSNLICPESSSRKLYCHGPLITFKQDFHCVSQVILRNTCSHYFYFQYCQGCKILRHFLIIEWQYKLMNTLHFGSVWQLSQKWIIHCSLRFPEHLEANSNIWLGGLFHHSNCKRPLFLNFKSPHNPCLRPLRCLISTTSTWIRTSSH